MGIRDGPVALRSLWQNGYAERLIGTLRRDCLDHVIAFNEAHLRRPLKDYADYYNAFRTHLALDKDAPLRRPVQRTRKIMTTPHLGGPHHSLSRI